MQAIYLDDQMSGASVYNNTFFDCQTGAFVGGGRYNLVKFNTFEQCDTAIHVDDRGLNWQAANCQVGGEFYQGLVSVNYLEVKYCVCVCVCVCVYVCACACVCVCLGRH